MKTTDKAAKKHAKKSSVPTSGTSDSESSSSSSSTDSEEERKRRLARKEKKHQKKEKKRQKREERKMKKKARKELKRQALLMREKRQREERKSEGGADDAAPAPKDCGKVEVPVPEVQDRIQKDHEEAMLAKSRSMAPMTKEEWEKRQSQVRKVYDPETGRDRIIKGDGEVLEEIVSLQRHKEINKAATKGDGDFFQKQLLTKNKNNS